jgi:hypothetical protein
LRTEGRFYKIRVDSPGILQAQLSNIPQDMKSRIDFYGDLQASLDSVPKSAKASMKGRIDLYGKNMNWITRKDAEKQGDNVLLKVDIPSAGWYYFGILDLNGGSYDGDYTFKAA